jgi:hypothetical protein
MKKNDKNQPPKGKNRGKPSHPENLKRGRESLHRDEPDASEGSGTNNPEHSEDSSPEDANGNWRRPITNQDEQEKITNEGSGETLAPKK